MNREIIITALNDDVDIFVLEDEKLVEYYPSDLERSKIAGNIYSGRVENIVKSLNAYFVNIGTGKNGFLRFKNTVPPYKKLKKGDKVLVQVKKEGYRRKGPLLTMKIDLVGSYLVYSPFDKNIGISRKIHLTELRERLRSLGKKFMESTPGGLIFRTKSANIPDIDIKKEFDKLVKLWEEIKFKFEKSNKPELLYEEQNSIDYILREKLDENTKKIITDSNELYKYIKNYIEKSKFKPLIVYDENPFKNRNLYSELNSLFSRKIHLKEGVTLTIDIVEALTIIDVDSESFNEGKNVEENALITNLLAAEEIARQLRLRNIGGVILIDFIDMKEKDNQEKVIKKLKEEFEKDKVKINIFGFTKLGLLELTRKRISNTFENFYFHPCPTCGGSGKILSPKYTYNRIIRKIKKDIEELRKSKRDIKEIKLVVHKILSGYFNRENIKSLEEELNIKLNVDFDFPDPNNFTIKFFI